jgi:hypothetical protein
MGVGLIVTTVILMIVFALQKEQPMSDEEIIERATALGMVMPEATDSSTLSSPDSLTEDLSGQEQTDMTDEGADAEIETDAEEPSAEPEKSENTQTPKSETVQQVEISIVGGEYSDVVCEKLRKAGVIDDVEDFNKYLSENGYDNLIQPGTYTIPLGADYDTVVQIITAKDETEE